MTKNNSNKNHAKKNHNTCCAISSAASLATGQAGTVPFPGICRPGPGESCRVPPRPGRSVGYLPDAPDGPPAPARTAGKSRCPPSHRPGERSVDQTGRRFARPAGRPVPSSGAGPGLARMGHRGGASFSHMYTA